MHAAKGTSPLKALYAVFVQPSLQSLSPAPATHHISRSRPTLRLHGRPTSIRPFHITSARLSRNRPPEKNLWDENIPAKRVQVIQEDKTLGPPVSRFDILARLDRKTHRLVCLVGAPERGRNAAVEGEWIPPCRVVSKKEQYEADKAKKSRPKEKKGDGDVKTLELNWAIDMNDLGHRLKRVEEFLNEGRRVEIVLARKKKGRKASEDECLEVLRRIRETVGGVDGAKESKTMEGKLGGIATLTLAGA